MLCRATGGLWAADPRHSHQFVLTPTASAWTMSCTWSDPVAPLPPAPAGGFGAAAIATRTAAEWARFWGTGAFLDLNGGPDGSATQVELERRVVLSQYLMR